MNYKWFNKSILLLFIFAAASVSYAAQTSIELKSPDNSISIIVNSGEKTTYTITRAGNTILEKSTMAIVVNDEEISRSDQIDIVDRYQKNETYATRGNHSMATNYCNGIIAQLKNESQPVMKVELRAFNDGVAWRHSIDRNGSNTVTKELTSFVIPQDSYVWFQDNCLYYEGIYERSNEIEDVRDRQSCGPPLTINLPGNVGYAAITEAGNVDFAGMALEADGKRGFTSRLEGKAVVDGQITTPWRVVMIGKDLNTLVNCDIVDNVSEPADETLFPEGVNTDWIKPGKCTWSWLADNGGVTFENMKKFTRMASELGIEYNLVDDGWRRWKSDGRDRWDMMKELVEYGNSLNVKTWVWKAYPDSDEMPGMYKASDRKAFLKKCKEVGVVGVKIDFFPNESQEILKFYNDVLKDAAELELMVDFHGANKPTGQSRTWPNEMTREGLRGLEYGENWAPLNTTHPFVRYLAGHGDYTPLNFGRRIDKTSWTHQIAGVITFTSPLMVLGVNPQDLIENKSREFVLSIPSTWDETIVLPCSEIGSLSAFARRKGDTWYLAVMNSNSPKTITIPLTFLGKGKYQSETIKDNLDEQFDVILESGNVKSSDYITIEMRGAGGYAATFYKAGTKM